MSKILRVTQAFSVLSDPNGHVYTPGELVDANHPHVKGREHMFETVEAHVSARAEGVEQATAAPGQKRTRTRAKKDETPAAPERPAPLPDPVVKSD